MKKGYDYLIIAFIFATFSSFLVKIGAMHLDIILFITIAHLIGSIIAFTRYRSLKKTINKKTAQISMKFGITIGIVNFFGIYTAIAALSIGPGALIFPLINLSLAFIVILSMILFRERLNWKGKIGVVLAVIAVLLLR